MNWYDISPADAVGINLAERLDITAPLNDEGERCPWPWEPELLGEDVPMGMFHCRYCGAMVLPGIRHLDYADGGQTPPNSQPRGKFGANRGKGGRPCGSS